MVEKNEIIIAANLFSFAGRSYWLISEGKKNLIKELCYKEEEKHGEKREDRQLERKRSMGRGETRVSDSEGVRREKVKGREKKWENLPWKREGTKKLCFPRLQMNIIFIGDATGERKIVFYKFFLENNL